MACGSALIHHLDWTDRTYEFADCVQELEGPGCAGSRSRRKLSASWRRNLVGKFENGPARHLVQCSVMSGVEVKADSKSIASFGRC